MHETSGPINSVHVTTAYINFQSGLYKFLFNGTLCTSVQWQGWNFTNFHTTIPQGAVSMPALTLAGMTSMTYNVVLTQIGQNCQCTQLRNGCRTNAHNCKVKAARCRVSGTSSRDVAAHRTLTTGLAHVHGYERAHSNSAMCSAGVRRGHSSHCPTTTADDDNQDVANT